MTVKTEISVCIFSYNFGKYIEQAIESVLAQKLSVPFEIVIGDDKSTDNSAEIICRYQQLYPDLIRAYINTENIGGTRNWLQTINACRGKYISLLDGDDYFIDELKLQKQYDILEANQGVTLCFHGVKEIYEDTNIGGDKEVRFKKSRFSACDVLEKGWFIRTGTMVFRRGLLPEEFPQWVYNFPYRLDSIIPVFLTIKGEAFYIDEICSVWRKHRNGMSYSLLEDRVRDSRVRLRLAEELDRYTKGKYAACTVKRVSTLYTALFFSILRSGALFKYFSLFGQSLVRMDYRKAFRAVKMSFIGVKKT